ncbi:MAG TPA: hypothetical protein VIV61_06645 [Candidatus Ozemobacteraceae bacterium]
MNFRIKLTIAVLAGVLFIGNMTGFAATARHTDGISKLTTGSDIPWPPPGNPADPTDPNNGNDDGSSSGGCDCGHDHDSGSSDSSYPDNPYDPNNEPMPN